MCVLLACAVLLAAAMLPAGGTRQSTESAAAIEAIGLQRLSGEYLAAAVADPLIIFDRTATIVHANAAAFAAFGGIAPGMSLSLKFRAPEMQALLDSVLSGNVASDVVDYIEKLPVERAYRVSASSVGHATDLYVLVFKDQSEARRIDRMRADFIANASHELRTPLASIAGFIETLRGPARNDPAAREQFLQIMQSQTGRMARLIDDLLSLSRLEMKPYLKPGTEVDLRQTIDSVIDSLGPLARENSVVIERDFAEGPLDVPGDRDELFQVFENLLGKRLQIRTVGRPRRGVDRAQRCRLRTGHRRHHQGFRPRHSRRTHSAHHRALLSRRCRDQPDPERHRPWPVDRQAYPDAPQRQALDQVRSRQGRGLLGSFADALIAP